MAAYLECQRNCLNFKDFADKIRYLTANIIKHLYFNFCEIDAYFGNAVISMLFISQKAVQAWIIENLL